MSRHCVFCGRVGPRCYVSTGWSHKTCAVNANALMYGTRNGKAVVKNARDREWREIE